MRSDQDQRAPAETRRDSATRSSSPPPTRTRYGSPDGAFRDRESVRSAPPSRSSCHDTGIGPESEAARYKRCEPPHRWVQGGRPRQVHLRRCRTPKRGRWPSRPAERCPNASTTQTVGTAGSATSAPSTSRPRSPPWLRSRHDHIQPIRETRDTPDLSRPTNRNGRSRPEGSDAAAPSPPSDEAGERLGCRKITDAGPARHPARSRGRGPSRARPLRAVRSSCLVFAVVHGLEVVRGRVRGDPPAEPLTRHVRATEVEASPDPCIDELGKRL